MSFKHLVAIFLAISAVKACTQEEQDNCQLPTCQCPSVEPPAGLNPDNIPQIVYLTFDDAVITENYPMYEELFFGRRNPNDQPITLTFFVTHEYNDYNLVHQLYRKGHEIAMHSITHQTNTEYWKQLDAEGWRKEILGQREQLAHFAKIPIEALQGMRAPFLQTGGDTMVSVISEELKWDCSRPTRIYLDPGLWPYTFDFDTLFQDCQIAPCSEEAYPGFWNVPMVDLVGGNGFPCAMLDTCDPQPNTTEGALNLLKDHFLRHYNGNRAPFGVFTHAAWLADTFPGHFEGYKAFLDYLATLPDVYIVSVSRGLKWSQNPTTLDAIASFEDWYVEELEDQCTTKYTCHFPTSPVGGERYMTSCVPCPRNYPWLDNPLGAAISGNKFLRN